MRTLLQMLVLLVVAGGLAFGSNAVRSRRLPWGGSEKEELVYRKIDWIDVGEAARLRDEVMTLFLDARPLAAFEKGRVFGAVSLPADDIQSAWTEIRDFLDPTMTLIVYADDPNLTVRVVDFLIQRSLPARGLSGGWEGWLRARQPLEGGS